MTPSFKLIHDLNLFLAPLDVKWFLSAGWAIDYHLQRITRERCDLDISVPFLDRKACIEFFLAQDWQVEGKLGDGFKTLNQIADYQNQIHYFWSFPKGVDFIRVYLDENGSRRINYKREVQKRMDYIEVFFDRIENQQFVYRRDSRVKMPVDQAVLQWDGIRYLAPEWVLLFKSKHLSEKNLLDFEAAIGSLDVHAREWLIQALSLIYVEPHPWLKKL